MISKETAIDIAMAYREIETATVLLTKITEGVSRYQSPDIRDAFGRQLGGLQLGVPSSESGHTLYNVPWNLAKPIIEAHIASKRAVIAALTEKARIELDTASVNAPAMSEVA